MTNALTIDTSWWDLIERRAAATPARRFLSDEHDRSLTFEDLQNSVRKPYFVPEDTALTQQLLEFQRRERARGYRFLS